MDPLTGSYKNMLLDVASCIEDEDLVRMKFRCDQIVKKAESQKISDPTQLFTALEQRERLGPKNLHFLKELLGNCCRGKLDGLRILEQYEREVGLSPPQPNTQPNEIVNHHGTQPQIIYVVNDNNQQPTKNNGFKRYDGPDLSREINYLSTKIGKDWRFFCRALGIPEEDIENICCEYRTVRERIFQCMSIWKQLGQQACSKYKLIDALRDSSVQRNDLATDLEEESYT